MYKVVSGRNGKRYLKDGRFVPKSQIPPEILEQLIDHVTAEIEPMRRQRVCIFCGEFADHTRFITLQTVELCAMHYYSENVGTIVHRLKELQDVQKDNE